jgi:antitoxin component YwqK of YwqJK toxin-antitoxin module
MRAEQTVVNELKDGWTRHWYENGQKESEGLFVNGRPVGVAKAWHKNGQQAFEMDLGEGVQTRWDENGQKISE